MWNCEHYVWKIFLVTVDLKGNSCHSDYFNCFHFWWITSIVFTSDDSLTLKAAQKWSENIFLYLYTDVHINRIYEGTLSNYETVTKFQFQGTQYCGLHSLRFRYAFRYTTLSFIVRIYFHNWMTSTSKLRMKIKRRLLWRMTQHNNASSPCSFSVFVSFWLLLPELKSTFQMGSSSKDALLRRSGTVCH